MSNKTRVVEINLNDKEPVDQLLNLPKTEKAVYMKTKKQQCRSFHFNNAEYQDEIGDTEKVLLNKPYLTPLITTFDRCSSKPSKDCVQKKRENTNKHKRCKTNKIEVDLTNDNDGVAAKKPKPKSLKKTTMYTLANKKHI